MAAAPSDAKPIELVQVRAAFLLAAWLPNSSEDSEARPPDRAGEKIPGAMGPGEGIRGQRPRPRRSAGIVTRADTRETPEMVRDVPVPIYEW